jgi:ABC-type phosphate/phosphonate transport system substrate-binding protein
MSAPEPLVVRSFLSELARPHYTAVAAIVARELGLPAPVVQPAPLADLEALAREPGIAFLCGLPYVRLRDAGGPVEPLAAPVAEGDAAPLYRADLLARDGLGARGPGDLAGRRVGYNGVDSLSGWVMPRAFLRRAGIDPDGFAWVRTGSHAASLEALAAGTVDAAPIDSGVHALAARANPRVARLAVLARLGPLPAPALVACSLAAEVAGRIRAVLVDLERLPGGRDALRLGAVARFAAVDDATYDPVRAVDAGEAAGRSEADSARPR